MIVMVYGVLYGWRQRENKAKQSQFMKMLLKLPLDEITGAIGYS